MKEGYVGLVLIVLLISTVLISGCVEVPESELETERHISILGDAEKEKIKFCSTINGVITSICVFDKEGNCSWIDGHVKFILKDALGNIIKMEEMDLIKKDIMTGTECCSDVIEIVIDDINQLDKITTIEVEYVDINGRTYKASEGVKEAFNYCY